MTLGKLTDAEYDALPEKQKRNLTQQPKVLALFREHDYLEAYSKHTDLRIAENGYKRAIGGGDNWEEHGDLQRDFLIKQGLLPHHRLLDIGCGTGRLARKIVPYLQQERYMGVDLSRRALDTAIDLSVSEGWADKLPVFFEGPIEPGCEIDFAWAYSVVIHLPLEVVADVMQRVAGRLRDTSSQFLFSFTQEERAWRSGLKQFRHTLADLKAAAKSAGLTFEEVEDWVVKAGYEPGRWSGGMHIACTRRRK